MHVEIRRDLTAVVNWRCVRKLRIPAFTGRYSKSLYPCEVVHHNADIQSTNLLMRRGLKLFEEGFGTVEVKLEAICNGLNEEPGTWRKVRRRGC